MHRPGESSPQKTFVYKWFEPRTITSSQSTVIVQVRAVLKGLFSLICEFLFFFLVCVFCFVDVSNCVVCQHREAVGVIFNNVRQ